MLPHVTFLSVLATFVAMASSQQCFGLDGAKLDETFAPCFPNAKHSGCCATKRSSGADLCLSNGLCMSTHDEFIGMIWQVGCTDSTGKDVACPKICPDTPNNFSGLSAVPAWNVQQCDYGTYCCRATNDRKSCCNNATAPTITTTSIGALLIQTSTPASSTTPDPTRVAATAVSTSSPFDATNSLKAVNCEKERHQTAIVGGTIGGLFGAIIVGLVGTILWMYKKEKRQRRLKEHYEEQFSQTAAYRRTIASTVSLMGSEELEEVKHKSTQA